MIPSLCLTLLAGSICFADTSPQGDFAPSAHFVLLTCATPAVVAKMLDVPVCVPHQEKR